MSDDEVQLPPEKTEQELEERHEREEEEMEAKVKAHVEATRAKAGKGKKAQQAIDTAEREGEQWMYDMKERQNAELELLQEHLKGGSEAAAEAPKEKAVTIEAPVKPAEVEETEEDKARRKKEKALQKRQGKAAKEAAKEAEKERERLEAGPSRRETELAALKILLMKQRPPLQISEIAADGHCLYRSIGDQLRRFRPDVYEFKKSPEKVHEEIRGLCAKALRKEVDNYSPFAELKDDEDFNGYCDRVENSADWGGELELRALADTLKVRIEVFRADSAQPLVLGESFGNGDEPLRVAFHQYFLALGEHYNSIVPASK
eukprot:TRINITY_DN96853_c0_g1_i1.p1 TRINITY_DN96853_c0_g1~~TRINITY_DN96853_c0_g1_i1.p1  ORF type:complete len:318 (+),score=110.36 TRINITY_DN96853_c0_g1_i1:92-1045(+)